MINIGTLYTLYAIEIGVLFSVLMARRHTKHFMVEGQSSLNQAEEKSNEEILKRKSTTKLDNIFDPISSSLSKVADKTGLTKVVDAVTDAGAVIIGTNDTSNSEDSKKA